MTTETKAAHTAGPWKFVEGDAETRAMSPIFAGPGSKLDWDNSKQTLIGWALCDSNRNQRPEDIANARLIAAAPDLLASLCEVLGTVDVSERAPSELGFSLTCTVEAARKARSAIAKAMGGDMINYSLLPDHLRGGMERYIDHGIVPGSFLWACIANDFIGAVCGADSETTTEQLRNVAHFLHNETPTESHGSRQRLEAWAESGGLEGQGRGDWSP